MLALSRLDEYRQELSRVTSSLTMTIKPDNNHPSSLSVIVHERQVDLTPMGRPDIITSYDISTLFGPPPIRSNRPEYTMPPISVNRFPESCHDVRPIVQHPEAAISTTTTTVTPTIPVTDTHISDSKYDDCDYKSLCAQNSILSLFQEPEQVQDTVFNLFATASVSAPLSSAAEESLENHHNYEYWSYANCVSTPMYTIMNFSRDIEPLASDELAYAPKLVSAAPHVVPTAPFPAPMTPYTFDMASESMEEPSDQPIPNSRPVSLPPFYSIDSSADTVAPLSPATTQLVSDVTGQFQDYLVSVLGVIEDTARAVCFRAQNVNRGVDDNHEISVHMNSFLQTLVPIAQQFCCSLLNSPEFAAHHHLLDIVQRMEEAHRSGSQYILTSTQFMFAAFVLGIAASMDLNKQFAARTFSASHEFVCPETRPHQCLPMTIDPFGHTEVVICVHHWIAVMAQQSAVTADHVGWNPYANNYDIGFLVPTEKTILHASLHKFLFGAGILPPGYHLLPMQQVDSNLLGQHHVDPVAYTIQVDDSDEPLGIDRAIHATVAREDEPLGIDQAMHATVAREDEHDNRPLNPSSKITKPIASGQKTNSSSRITKLVASGQKTNCPLQCESIYKKCGHGHGTCRGDMCQIDGRPLTCNSIAKDSTCRALKKETLARLNGLDFSWLYPGVDVTTGLDADINMLPMGRPGLYWCIACESAESVRCIRCFMGPMVSRYGFLGLYGQLKGEKRLCGPFLICSQTCYDTLVHNVRPNKVRFDHAFVGKHLGEINDMKRCALPQTPSQQVLDAPIPIPGNTTSIATTKAKGVTVRRNRHKQLGDSIIV